MAEQLTFPLSSPNEALLAEGAVLLRRFALPVHQELLSCVATLAAEAPFRHMSTPGGFRMSVAMTNCGALGWTSDGRGYRYTRQDPLTQRDWPPLPDVFTQLAKDAANLAGFEGFEPDACLINRYQPGSRLALHQDRNELDFGAPIVSVSLGLPAVFLFGGQRREQRPQRVPLEHGDVVVWGGPARSYFHGVAPLREGVHATCGPYRFNLTLRKAG